MNNIILRVQAPTNLEADEILSINGVRKKRDEFDYFFQSEKTLKVEKSYQTLFKDQYLSIYRIKDGNYVILSNFAEKDDANRRISYSAFIDAKSNDDVLPLLKDEAQLYGYNLYSEDEEKIKQSLSGHGNNKTWEYAIVALLLVLIAIIILVIIFN